MTETAKQEVKQKKDGKKVILVAEDDIYYANIYKVKLTKEGFDVVIAANGDWAIKLARQKKPDLVLLDLIMPVKDGFEFLKEIKKDPILAKTKIVVLSNLGQEEDIKKAREYGIDGYFIKTNVSIQELVSKIKMFVN